MNTKQAVKTASESLFLVWIDMEMSGLNPEHDAILEMATIITDASLNILATGPELIIHQGEALLQKMDEWNRSHHSRSGLLEKVRQSRLSHQEAEAQTLAFIQQHVKEKQGILAGNSIWQDRRFIARYMSQLDSYLHYRMLDVSSLKILAQHWYGNLKFTKKEAHRAMADIQESIEELRFYRRHCFREPPSAQA